MSYFEVMFHTFVWSCGIGFTHALITQQSLLNIIFDLM